MVVPIDLVSTAAVSKQRGSIELICGPVSSGKTTEMFRRLRRYARADKAWLLYKYAKDTRYDKVQASTHDQTKMDATAIDSIDDVREEDVKAVDVIALEEAQFLGEGVAAFAEHWANQGKIVIVCALEATFERKPFPNIVALFHLVEQVTKLQAICTECHHDAAFSQRMSDDMRVEVIGGIDLYKARCRQCFQAPATRKRPLDSGDAVPAKRMCTDTPE